MSSSSSTNANTSAPASSSQSNPEKQKRPQPTHFLCLPLYPQSTAIFSTQPPPRPQTLLPPSPAHAALKHSLRKLLKDEAESDELNHNTLVNNYDEATRIPRDAFRPFGTLHLTLGVMSLSTQEDVQRAVGVLHNIDLRGLLTSALQLPSDSGGGGEGEGGGGVKLSPSEPSDNGHKLLISLKGLRSMQTPKKTTVLYTHPTPYHATSSSDDPLYNFASSLREHFVTEGLIQPEERKFVLHATVVNTIYSKSTSKSSNSGNNRRGNRGRGGRGGSGRKEKLVIDASDVIDKYADTVFVEGLEVDRVELCKMGARKGEEVIGDDGEVEVKGAGYEVVAWKWL